MTLQSLINVEPYSDGLGLSDGRNTYTLKLNSAFEAQQFLVILDRLVQQRSVPAEA